MLGFGTISRRAMLSGAAALTLGLGLVSPSNSFSGRDFTDSYTLFEIDLSIQRLSEIGHHILSPFRSTFRIAALTWLPSRR